MSASFWFDRLMGHVDSTPELDLAERKRERHGGKRDQHQHPERIHVTQEGRLRLHLRANPLNGLVMGLRQRAAMVGEEACDLLQRVLILRAGWNDLLDESVLVELLAGRQHV